MVLLLSTFVFDSRLLAQSSDEAAIRKLAENYFAAYAKEDLDAITKMWSDKSPDLVQAKSKLKEFFSRNDQIESKNLTLRRLAIDGDRATALVTIEVAATDARTKTPSEGLGKVNQEMSFVREAGEWRIWHSGSAEEELAGRLIAAKSDADREALLAEAKELLVPALANALFRAGERFRFRQEFEQAMTAYRLQLLLAERAAAKGVMAAALNNISLVYRAQGNYEQALDSAQKSVRLKKESGNKGSIVNTLGNVADIYVAEGNYAAAMEVLQRMLTISEELNDKRLIAKTLITFAVVHEAQYNTTAALDYYQRALSLSEEVGEKIIYSSALQSIGGIQLHLGNYDAALDVIRKNLALLEAAGHKAGIAYAIRDIARVHSAQGDHIQAMENFQRALALMDEGSFKEGNADILRGLANEHMILGDYEKVIALVQRSSDLERKIGSLPRLASFLTLAGQAYHALGRTDEARRAFDEAIALIETLRTQLAGGEQERERYFEERISPYNSMVELLVSQNKPGEALIYA